MSEPDAGVADETGTGLDQGASATSDPKSEGQGGYLLDVSALLCLMNDEPGADRVAAVLPRAIISTINLAEVVTKLSELGADAGEARALLAPLHLAVASFDEGTAFATGALRNVTRAYGLSLGDHACLALAATQGATTLTTDNAWRDAATLVGVTVETLR